MVPVLAVATGPVISGPALLLGLADVVVMTPEAMAFVSGPSMVAQITGVEVRPEELGGAGIHARVSGLCAIEASDPVEAVGQVLAYLPDHADAEPARLATADPDDRPVPELRQVVPSRGNASYDVRAVIGALADDGEFLELAPRWAPQMVVALTRLGGRAVGVVANQPRALAGTLDIAASQKAARFVRWCDAYNLGLLTLVDTPGFLPGKDLEWRGMIRHGAELAFAYAEATVPRVCVLVRKAFGGAYIVMDSKGLGNDLCLAWPGAEVAVMGAAGAVQILHRRADPAARTTLEERYAEEYLTPWAAAERGFVDAVVDPADTRRAVVTSFDLLWTKREHLVGRKHDNGPV
jgi:acetyl-CoA carboxylase carboxyltransferase component